MIEKAHSKLIEHGTTLNREQRQELIDELLILFNVNQQRELCKHENYTPYYGQEGDYWGKRCDDCGDDLD